MPGKDVWSGVKVPLFLVAGESDSITPASEVEHIAGWLKPPQAHGQETANDQVKEPALPKTTGDMAAAENNMKLNRPNANPPRTQSGNVIQDEKVSSIHSFALKTTIFPGPAAHGLMYSTSTVRTLAGMIESFLSDHIDERLGAAWQLHTLTTAGKWDVKNLKKWQAVEACSEPIGGIFRAMKTMREVDDVHSPREFVKHWSSAVMPDGVAVVMDISHETPVYRPAGLEDGGIEYIKFPTVSKEKPKAEEVDQFIALVDKLRKSPKFKPTGNNTVRPTIGVHCHYGFNRTGFFIVCYLVEREGYRLQDAMEEFKQKRPPGVKHDHFVNELYVRYAVKMERRGTIQVE
jgi:protein-tyrosine phosphatase